MNENDADRLERRRKEIAAPWETFRNAGFGDLLFELREIRLLAAEQLEATLLPHVAILRPIRGMKDHSTALPGDTAVEWWIAASEDERMGVKSAGPFRRAVALRLEIFALRASLRQNSDGS